MPTKAQHDGEYEKLPPLLRAFREEADLRQRELGEKLKKPQSWVYSSEKGIRRVDLAEFVKWCKACGVKPADGFARYLRTRR